MILKYNKFIKESNKIDSILDKINKVGVDKLSDYDKKYLDIFSRGEDVDIKDVIITKINDMVSDTYDSFIWMYKISPQDIIYKEEGNETHIIESLSIDMLSINIYEGGDTYIDTYDLEYIDLDIELLNRILELLIKNI